MSVQWFPGHMHLTRQAIAERVKSIDVVIEMLDARLPGSSANPLLAELTKKRATLKVLNKQDLADPERTVMRSRNSAPNSRHSRASRPTIHPLRVCSAAFASVWVSPL